MFSATTLTMTRMFSSHLWLFCIVREMVIASSTSLHFFWDQSTVLTFNLLIQLFPWLCVMLCTLCDETFVLMFMKVLTQINSSDLSLYTSKAASNKDNISFQSDSMTSWALHLKKQDHISGISTKVGLQICRIGN